MRTAFSYRRFSSGKQAEGDSDRRQKKGFEDWCRKHPNVKPDTSLTLDAGVSGWKGKNVAVGSLGVFLEYCKSGRVKRGDFLVVEHLDRLTRDEVKPALTLWLQIQSYGVWIETLEPERSYNPEANDALSLIEPILMFVSNNEKSANLSKRLRDVWSEKRKSGKPLTAWCPHWLKLNEDRDRYEIIPEATAIVRRIVSLAIDHDMGAIRIAQTLNGEKVPGITGRKGYWSHPYITKILNNPALIGQYTTEGETEPREDYFPAIIDKDTWYRLRAALTGRRGKGGRVGEGVANLFAGLLVNGKDGLAMQRIVKNHPRLISAAFRNGLDGDTQSFPYEPLERAVMFAITNELQLSDITDEGPRPDMGNLDGLTGQLITLDGRLSEISARIKTSKKAIGPMLDLLTELSEQRETLIAEIESYKAAQAMSHTEVDTLSELQAFGKLFKGDKPIDSATRTIIRAKLRRLVERMVVCIFGKKRSKFKTAQVQIFFKSGGSYLVNVLAHETKIKQMFSVSGVPSEHDFRWLLIDPKVAKQYKTEVETVRKYLESKQLQHEKLVEGFAIK